MRQKVFCFLACLLFSCITVSAQNSFDHERFKTGGGIAGYGQAKNKETSYKIIFLAGDFSWSFTKYPKKADFVAWYFEPQINPVRTPRPLDIEFGTNLGVRNYIKINRRLFFYQMIGSGPHFISADVKRQAKGFIFSDNFAIGVFTGVGKKRSFLNFQLRYRHISNAGLKSPNGGIDSYNFLIGMSGFY